MDRRSATARTHREQTAEAGFPSISFISLLAGLVTAYGTFAVVAAIAGSALSAADVSTDFRTNDWTGSGAVAALTSAVVLLLAYLFGGYVTGRMARRAAVLHGVLLFVATLIVGAIAGGVVAGLTDDAEIRSNLRTIGVPTTWNQVNDVAVAGVIVSLVAILLGSVAGCILGERWHTKLARRIDDPEIGTTAAERRRLEDDEQARRARLEDEERARRDRIAQDPTVATADRSDRTAGADDRTVDLTAEERRPTVADTIDGDGSERRYTEAEWREVDRRRSSSSQF